MPWLHSKTLSFSILVSLPLPGRLEIIRYLAWSFVIDLNLHHDLIHWSSYRLTEISRFSTFFNTVFWKFSKVRERWRWNHLWRRGVNLVRQWNAVELYMSYVHPILSTSKGRGTAPSLMKEQYQLPCKWYLL